MQLGKVIEYVEGCQKSTPTSITLYNPHSWRGSERQLWFDYKLKPSTTEKMLEVLRSAIGMECWKGGPHYIGRECFVYLEGGSPLNLLMLQHIMGYVYVQDSAEHWLRPYLAGDRKKLEQIHKILVHAADDTDISEVWVLAKAMQTHVGPHSVDSLATDGDLLDARLHYEKLCARLGEVEYPYTYTPDHE